MLALTQNMTHCYELIPGVLLTCRSKWLSKLMKKACVRRLEVGLNRKLA